jgi:antitoxin HicB
MGDFAYPAKIMKRRGGAYEVQFIDLDDAFTCGDTLEEALDYASEVLSGVILTKLELGIDVRPPSKSMKGKNIYYVLPDGKTQSALLIREAFSGRNVAKIARSMDTSWPAVNRLKNPAHWPTLKLLERALRAAGKQLVIGMKDRPNGLDSVRHDSGAHWAVTGKRDVRDLKGVVSKPARSVSIDEVQTALKRRRGRR